MGGRERITVYHNPMCSKSRGAIAIIRQAGIEPDIIEYLATPPSREQLQELLTAMGKGPRDLLRQKETPYDELGLGDPSLTDEHLLDAMLAHPILIERPIVVSCKGVKICRPSEEVIELLPRRDICEFTTANG